MEVILMENSFVLYHTEQTLEEMGENDQLLLMDDGSIRAVGKGI